MLLAYGMGIVSCGIVSPRGASSGSAPVVKASQVTRVVWFAGRENRGLRQNSAGDLFVSRHRLAIDGAVPRLYAAACYPGAGTLVTVDANAVTRLYEGTGESLKLMETRRPRRDVQLRSRRHVRPMAVGFCNVPGLVYLTWTFREERDTGTANLRQIPTAFTERIALGSRAHGWHAVRTETQLVWPAASFMKCTYRMASARSVYLFMPDGNKIFVRLPSQLAPRPLYGDSEPVSVIPGRAIICKTRNGWSMYNLKGNLVRYFPFGRLACGEWHEPIYRSGHFYVPLYGAKSAGYYRMDIPTGKLVDVGSSFPQ